VRGPDVRRGGHATWVVAADDHGVALLRDHGGSVLPFTATDGGGLPWTATCTPDGFAVWTARTSEPPGIVLAWDVQRTSYRLDGTALTRTGSEQVEDHVADPTMRRKMPQLFEQDSAFADCG
jgi:hypothetical protein